MTVSTHQITEKASSIATYTGGGSAVLFGLSANEFAAVIGAVVAVLGLLVNMWFRWQHLRIVKQAAAERPDCATCPEREV
jgi:hypothetical protein